MCGCLCVCVCACVRACVRACVCVCVCVCVSVYAFRIAPSVTFALYKSVYCYHHDYYSYVLVSD